MAGGGWNRYVSWSGGCASPPAVRGRENKRAAGRKNLLVTRKLIRTVPVLAALATALASSDADAAPLALVVDGAASTLPLTPAFVLPGAKLELRLSGGSGKEVVARAATGMLEETPTGYVWTAPRGPGSYDLSFRQQDDRRDVRVFVLQPYDGSDAMDGYAIGRYEPDSTRRSVSYRVPRGLVKVTKESERTAVSPSFELGQFLCKQTGGHPKFLALQTRLVLKLEALLAEVRASGFAAPTLFIMSGYRTPLYNQRIGNETRWSRHLYGDAADVFIDADGSGSMDDVTGDGVVTIEDARVLYAVAERLGHAPGAPIRGGLGLYAPAPHRGPFVHVDTRGYEARW